MERCRSLASAVSAAAPGSPASSDRISCWFRARFQTWQGILAAARTEESATVVACMDSCSTRFRSVGRASCLVERVSEAAVRTARLVAYVARPSPS